MRVLVVINCSKKKVIDLGIVRSRLGTVPSFDLEREYEYRQVLSDLVKPAIEMYDGPEFKVLRRFRGCIDVFILSARYGIIRDKDLIIPYDAYLNNADYSVISTWAMYGNWGLNELTSKTWDLAIIRLSKVYTKFFMKLIKNPCALGNEVHIIGGRYIDLLNCEGSVRHHIRGPGEAQHVLYELLSRACNDSSTHT
jgi:hypothetical protein